LFLLEFGADNTTDHTVVLARRTGIPDSLIGLFIIGGGWKQVCPCTSPLAGWSFYIESLYFQLAVIMAVIIRWSLIPCKRKSNPT